MVILAAKSITSTAYGRLPILVITVGDVSYVGPLRTAYPAVFPETLFIELIGAIPNTRT
jgi:hypothetical protein